jgi:hypothetical protein
MSRISGQQQHARRADEARHREAPRSASGRPIITTKRAHRMRRTAIETHAAERCMLTNVSVSCASLLIVGWRNSRPLNVHGWAGVFSTRRVSGRERLGVNFPGFVREFGVGVDHGTR